MTLEPELRRLMERADLSSVTQYARGRHDEECEWSREENFYLCNCSKRRREAEGFTTPPTEDLDFPPPYCPRCNTDLWHDGDGWVCDDCHLAWDSHGDGSSAHFTDDYGDLSRCEEHGGRRGCIHPKGN